MTTTEIIQKLSCRFLDLELAGIETVQAAVDKLQYFDALLQTAKHAYLDLKGIMPEFEPNGDREHSGWDSLEELETVIGWYDPSFQGGSMSEPNANIIPTDDKTDKALVVGHELEMTSADLEIVSTLLAKEKKKSEAFADALQAIRAIIWPPGPTTMAERDIDALIVAVLKEQLC